MMPEIPLKIGNRQNNQAGSLTKLNKTKSKLQGSNWQNPTMTRRSPKQLHDTVLNIIYENTVHLQG